MNHASKYKQWVKNSEELAVTPERRLVLDVIEAGYNAIDTRRIIETNVFLYGNKLSIKGREFDLTDVENVYVIGFGKASCLAASALDEVLGKRINSGVAIGLSPIACDNIQTFGGTHPLPSVQNVEISEKIMELSKHLTEKDLVITIVSGGGSALLCWPLEECKQANRLYEEFLKTGGNVKELNTIRKHISSLKGGGLAKHLYPAQVVGLIFSDVPGDDNFDYIASGPTYKDITTVADAQAILDKYGLSGYTLNETPNEDIYFEKVVNIPLVSNVEALKAMKSTAETLDVKAEIISAELYDSPEQVVKKLLKAAKPGWVILGGGEPKAIVTVSGGTGGRCARLGLEMLPHLTEKDVFAAVASDGLDNSPQAGVIEDASSLKKVGDLKIDMDDYLARWDSQTFYELLGNEQLYTGPTEANVSDLFIFYRAK